ncbi:MAG: hypothetical protein JJU36_12190 [Phycisphaeraceae bacterium]|nr:hypothetical protein [Phycisphaeraceae bacterium]
MDSSAPASQPPSIIALMIADAVYVDHATRKTTIAGAINRLVFNKNLPARVNRPLTIFISMIDPRGIVNFEVALEHADTGKRVFELRGPLTTRRPEPHAVMDMHLEVNDLQFSNSGLHWLLVKADEEILNQRPLWVIERSDKTGPVSEQGVDSP